MVFNRILDSILIPARSAPLFMTSRRKPSKSKNREFVYFEDRGSVFDAPIDVVWDYILNGGEYHSKAHHASLRNFKWKNLSEITGAGSCEVVRGGQWSKMKFRSTNIPPFVRISEEFEGRYAGQKLVFLYMPKGKRTGIDVFGYTPIEVEKETRDTLAKTFAEDAPAVRAYAGRKRQPRPLSE